MSININIINIIKMPMLLEANAFYIVILNVSSSFISFLLKMG